MGVRMAVVFFLILLMKHTALFIAALLAAAVAQAQTIEDVLRSVEQNNVELKAARKGNEAAALEAKQVNNLEGLSVEYSPFFSGEVGGIASSELVVSQGFDFPTLYGARKKANRLQGDVRDMEYQTARRDILLQAKNFCLDLIFLNKQKAVLDERRKNADELLATFTEKYAKGDATSLELNKIKMERMNLETELVQAETARTTALRGLQAVNGGVAVDVTSTDYPAAPAGGYEALYERAVAADRTVMAAQAAVRAVLLDHMADILHPMGATAVRISFGPERDEALRFVNARQGHVESVVETVVKGVAPRLADQLRDFVAPAVHICLAKISAHLVARNQRSVGLDARLSGQQRQPPSPNRIGQFFFGRRQLHIQGKLQ